jgi:hypothetical protein
MNEQPKTIRQKKFFKYVMTAKSFAQAARTAGYSEKSARVSAHKNISKYNDFFINLFQEAEIDLDTLALNLKKGLNSTNESVRFRYTKLALDLVEKVLKVEDEEVLRSPRMDCDQAEEERLLQEAFNEL